MFLDKYTWSRAMWHDRSLHVLCVRQCLSSKKKHWVPIKNFDQVYRHRTEETCGWRDEWRIRRCCGRVIHPINTWSSIEVLTLARFRFVEVFKAEPMKVKFNYAGLRLWRQLAVHKACTYRVTWHVIKCTYLKKVTGWKSAGNRKFNQSRRSCTLLPFAFSWAPGMIYIMIFRSACINLSPD